MLYKFLLENRVSGENAYVEAPAKWPLEALSAKIKVAMHLNYVDYGWHHFCLNGKRYVPSDNVGPETEIWFECCEHINQQFASSDGIRLKRAFNVLGSAVNYVHGNNKIRCTLVQRIAVFAVPGD